MKKLIGTLLFAFAVLALTFSSCDETKTEGDGDEHSMPPTTEDSVHSNGDTSMNGANSGMNGIDPEGTSSMDSQQNQMNSGK